MINLEYIRNGEIFYKFTNINIKKKYKEDLREKINNYIIKNKDKLIDIEFIYDALVKGLKEFLIEKIKNEANHEKGNSKSNHFLILWFGGKSD